jgi:hypothetical protein
LGDEVSSRRESWRPEAKGQVVVWGGGETESAARRQQAMSWSSSFSLFPPSPPDKLKLELQQKLSGSFSHAFGAARYDYSF